MSNEREILAYSLAPEGASAEAEIKWLLPKGADCPLTADLILLAKGETAPDVAGRLKKHLEGCDACLASFRGFERALKRYHEDPVDPPPPEPATPAGGQATRREWDAVVRRVADLFAGGALAGPLLELTGLAPEDILTALCEARDRGLLEGTFAGGMVFQTAAAPRPPRGEPKSLLDLLRDRSQNLRHVTVCQSYDTAAATEGKWAWDERIRYFGCEAAPLLVSLLSRASFAGVGWGRMVAAAIQGVKLACESPPPRPRGPLVCVATVGGLIGELKVRAESSSSIQAARLTEAINGNWDHLYTLTGVEGFIASYLGRSDEVDMIRRRISCFPNYQAIFGGPGRPGLIDQLDAIVTSCGNAHHYNQFWTTELPRLNVSPERLNTLTHGNIGGVLLEREDLAAKDKGLIDDITRRWTGITRRHYEQCAKRNPGVILLALRNNKADVVLKCVELGLVTELIIDEDLAMALWDRVDPEKHYPRTPEAVPTADDTDVTEAPPRNHARKGN
jgi:DNA-binding transcriptional regulator LsrR (DeoR family)